MFNYDELLHYQILDDRSNFNKYVVTFSIETPNKHTEPEPSRTQPTKKQTEPSIMQTIAQPITQTITQTDEPDK